MNNYLYTSSNFYNSSYNKTNKFLKKTSFQRIEDSLNLKNNLKNSLIQSKKSDFTNKKTLLPIEIIMDSDDKAKKIYIVNIKEKLFNEYIKKFMVEIEKINDKTLKNINKNIEKIIYCKNDIEESSRKISSLQIKLKEIDKEIENITNKLKIKNDKVNDLQNKFNIYEKIKPLFEELISSFPNKHAKTLIIELKHCKEDNISKIEKIANLTKKIEDLKIEDNKNLEKQENNINDNKNLLGIPNESEEEIKVLHSSTLIDKNEIKIEDIDTKIKKKKEQNERIQSRILAGLNSNSKMKEGLKNLILSQNKKLYFCIKCNSLIEKTLLDKSNCNFDKSCTNRSYLYCKKCKLHLCTKCVVYQRGMKCGKNHKYFQKPVNTKEELKCYICNKANVFPYYECKYCKEQICSDCAIPPSARQNTCFNCNNELIWRKCIYSTCDRCHKLSDCFYFCVCCDYSICINCASLPKNMCGALHNLEEIDLMENLCLEDKKSDNQSLNFNKIYCYNYPVLFNGKCSWCNITVGKSKIWGCLRCSLFLCDKCKIKNDD